MVETYIELKKSISLQEENLKSEIVKSRQDILDLENQIEKCQNSLEKGNGFSSLLLSTYSEKLEVLKKDTILNLSKKKGELEKSKRDLAKLIEKNKSLTIFENYSQVIPSEEFKKSLVDLIEGHKLGVISDEILEKAKKNSLKFKELEFEGEKYQVKDNRVNYSDMIIFNQENKILFVKRNKDDSFEPGKYALPGGHVEPAEDPKLAAIREVQEEIFLTIDKNKVVPVGIYEDSKVVINYFCTKLQDTAVNLILEERELQQYEWVSVEDISDLDLILNLKDNFENIIEIPVTILENTVDSKEILAFYGIPGQQVVGSGYPI